jgi:hypothetical protein
MNGSFVFGFAFFLVVLAFLLGSSVLVLLVLRHQIVHVGFSLSEFHLVHTFTSVPMQKGLSPEHSSELFGYSLEHLLDGSGVTNKGSGHLQSLGGDVTDG